MKDLFYDRITNTYVYCGNLKCCECGGILSGTIEIHGYIEIKHFFEKVVCSNCEFSKADLMHLWVAHGKIPALIVDRSQINYDLLAVSMVPCNLQSGRNLTVYDIEEIEKLGGETIDNTKLAGRETIQGARIGLNPHEVLDKSQSPTTQEIGYIMESKIITAKDWQEQERREIEEWNAKHGNAKRKEIENK